MKYKTLRSIVRFIMNIIAEVEYTARKNFRREM